MAHNLNFNNGKASFFSVKEKAWHGLGTIVQDVPNSEEAIKLAGLDYEVALEPVIMANSKTVIPNTFATYRKDNGVPFGTVGSQYTILQNKDAFGFFDNIVGKGEAIFQTAGALGKGETIFITAKLPEYIQVGKADLIEQYLFLTTSHDGSGTTTAAFTPIRIVCNNTLTAALKANSMRVKIRHTANQADKLREAAKLMGIVNKLKTELEEVYNAMARKPIVDQQLKDLIVATFAKPAQLSAITKGDEKSVKSLVRFESLISDVYAYAQISDTQQMSSTRGTVFGAYNAITGYLQNVKSWPSEESKLINHTIKGSALAQSQTAFDLCVAMLK